MVRRLLRALAVVDAGTRLLFGDHFTPATNGGITVYYVSNGAGKVSAFKPVGPVQSSDLRLRR